MRIKIYGAKLNALADDIELHKKRRVLPHLKCFHNSESSGSEYIKVVANIVKEQIESNSQIPRKKTYQVNKIFKDELYNFCQ